MKLSAITLSPQAGPAEATRRPAGERIAMRVDRSCGRTTQTGALGSQGCRKADSQLFPSTCLGSNRYSC